LTVQYTALEYFSGRASQFESTGCAWIGRLRLHIRRWRQTKSLMIVIAEGRKGAQTRTGSSRAQPRKGLLPSLQLAQTEFAGRMVVSPPTLQAAGISKLPATLEIGDGMNIFGCQFEIARCGPCPHSPGLRNRTLIITSHGEP
jgi:hypothetical protein